MMNYSQDIDTKLEICSKFPYVLLKRKTHWDFYFINKEGKKEYHKIKRINKDGKFVYKNAGSFTSPYIIELMGYLMNQSMKRCCDTKLSEVA
ncbi:MAG: hypothetical protein KDK96_12280 [Chlamydiia bacterium]|nr:hypothetical protein [Chlamydiia bacterium]